MNAKNWLSDITKLNHDIKIGYLISASSAGPSLGTVQFFARPTNNFFSRAQQRIFSRFPLPPLKATGDEADLI